MRLRTIRRLFLAWRDRGDAGALARLFDATSPELASLAAHLAHDADQAQEVLQETYLAVLSAAKRYDASRPLMPWMVGILAREARAARRAAARRPDPLRLERPTLEVEDASLGAEREELSAALARALDDLPPDDRQVLRPYLEEGRAPREIAREHGLAAGTARVRIYRALRRLRRALPAGLALSGGVVLTPAQLATVRRGILQAGAPSGHAVALGTVGASQRLASAAALTLVAGGGLVATWALTERFRGGGATEAVVAELTPSAAQGSGGQPLSAPDPGPPVGAGSSSSPSGEPAPVEAGRRAASSAFSAGATLLGRVVPAEGVSIDDWDAVRMSFHSEEVASRFFSRFQERGSTRCDEGGSFELELDAPRPGRLVVRHPELALLERLVTFEGGPRVDLGELRLAAGISISGWATFRGEPLGPSDRVIAWSRAGGGPWLSHGEATWDGQRFRHRKREVPVGPGGSFSIVGLLPGTYEVAAVPARFDGHTFDYLRAPGDGVEVTAPAEGIHVESLLEPVELQLLCGERPVTRAAVRRRPVGRTSPDIAMLFLGHGVDAEGMTRFWMHPGVKLDLEVDAPGYEEFDRRVAIEDFGASGRLTVQLTPAAEAVSLILAFSGPGAAELEGASLGLMIIHGGIHSLPAAQVSGGQVVFADVPAGKYQGALTLFPREDLAPEDQSWALLTGGVKVPDVGERGAGVGVPVELGGRIRLRLFGLGEEPADLSLEGPGWDGRPILMAPRPKDQGTEFLKRPCVGRPILLGPALSPGRYVLRQVGAAYEEAELEVEVRAGITSDLELVLRPSRP